LYKSFQLFLLMPVFLFLLVKPLSASENDSYTRRFEPLPDQTDFLNRKVNEFLKKAVDKTNYQTRKLTLLINNSAEPKTDQYHCNSELLYFIIRTQLARPVVGQLESLVDELPKKESRKVSFEESIYQDFTIAETPTLSGVKKMGSLVRMQDSIVGADKFGHFFSEGWTYFSVSYADEPHIEAALLFGEISESVLFGALTTGVYSYGDLTANFNGMRFWNDILGLHPDVLDSAKMPAPYIQCTNNRWKIVREFDWRDYVDAAWDEGINCSSFRNDVLQKKVSSRIDFLNQSKKQNRRCPLEPGKIEPLRKKYGEYSGHLLNSKGHTILAEHLQPKILLDKYWKNRMQKSEPKWKTDLFNLIELRLKELQNSTYYQNIISRHF